jgi:hypothetical protein
MPPMTRAQGHANWIRRPSLSQPLLRSTLRALAMLVSLVARLFSPKPPNPTAECDGSPALTPEAEDVLDQPEGALLLLLPTTTAAAAVVGVTATRSEPTEGLTLRTIAQAIVDSKGEDGLHRTLHRSSSGNRPTPRLRRTGRLPENDLLLGLWANSSVQRRSRIGAQHTPPA